MINKTPNTEKINGIELTKVNNSHNGISRVVVHYLNFLTENEMSEHGVKSGEHLFNIALERAKKIGGKKYRAKWYGGGIVFQCQNKRILTERINEIVMEAGK